MEKIKQAAILMLGLGERHAAEILKTMDPEQVEKIIDVVNQLGEVTERDLVEALNSFFKDTNDSSGLDIVSKETLKSSLISVAESKKIGKSNNSGKANTTKYIDVFKYQAPEMIYSIVQDEHPQVIAVITSLILNSDQASKLIKRFPTEIKSEIVTRMAKLSQVSSFAMESLATLFENELKAKEDFNEISVDGVEAVAGIMSHLDIDSEKEVFDGISNSNTELSQMIQEKMLPFEKLAQMDKRSLQTLLTEVENDDMVLALKGAEPYVKNTFLKNMSQKSADILLDELDSTGPVKIANVIEAQKRIVAKAKSMAAEEKIILNVKADLDVIY